MEKVLNFASHAISRLESALLPKASAVTFERPDCSSGWQEDYLIGTSDTDARWYYERRYWRS